MSDACAISLTGFDFKITRSAKLSLSIFAAESTPTEDWKLVKQTNGVAIYSRPHAGSKLKEFKAIGEIDASTKIVKTANIKVQ